MKGLFSWNSEGEGFKKSGLSRGVVSHQGGLSTGILFNDFWAGCCGLAQ